MNLDIQHFKTLLEVEQSKLEKELQTLGLKDAGGVTWQATQKEDETAVDPDYIPSNLESYEDRERTISILETEFHEVNHALEKISAGTYGICEVSGAQIELDRLEAYPAARTAKAHMN